HSLIRSPSIADCEVRKAAFGRAPLFVDTLDARQARPAMEPAEQLPQRRLFAFRHELHGALVEVLHPAAEAQPLRLAPRGRAEVHSLHEAVDHAVEPPLHQAPRFANAASRERTQVPRTRSQSGSVTL